MLGDQVISSWWSLDNLQSCWRWQQVDASVELYVHLQPAHTTWLVFAMRARQHRIFESFSGLAAILPDVLIADCHRFSYNFLAQIPFQLFLEIIDHILLYHRNRRHEYCINPSRTEVMAI
jgi:hypothetical protein